MADDELAIIIEGRREGWPSGARTLTPCKPCREPNRRTYWFGAELGPDGTEIWFRIDSEAIHRMPERTPRDRAAFRREEERREGLVAELGKARLTGIRVKLPAETPDTKLASLPEGVSVARGRIEVRFNGAKEAMEWLYPLAHALINDYERFEELVDGGGEVVNESRKPWCRPRPRWRTDAPGSEPTSAVTGASSAAIVLPQMIAVAGPAATERFLEFFGGGSRTRGRGWRTRGRRGSSSGGARLEASGSKRSCRSTWPPTSGPSRGRPRPRSSTSRPSACSATGSSLSHPGEPRRGCQGAEARRHQGRDAGPLTDRGEEAPRAHRYRHFGRLARPGAPLRDALQLRGWRAARAAAALQLGARQASPD